MWGSIEVIRHLADMKLLHRMGKQSMKGNTHDRNVNESTSRQDLNRVISVIGIVLPNLKKPNLGIVNNYNK